MTIFRMKALVALPLLLLTASAFGKPALQRSLPSEVKRISVRKNKRLVATRSREKKAEILAASPLEAGQAFFKTRSVFFWKSPSRLPKSYRCDEATQESKKQDAVDEAMSKCFGQGEENCRVQRVRIVKNGPLSCGDIPGGCQKRRYYAGCVASAEVVGEQSPTIAEDTSGFELGAADPELPNLDEATF